MPDRPDLTELERLLATMVEPPWDDLLADDGCLVVKCASGMHLREDAESIVAAVNALPFLLAEARKVETLRGALAALRSRASSEPLGVDVSDYGDEWALGFLAGQANALDEFARAALEGASE